MPKKRSLTTDDVVRILRERDPDTHPVVTSTYVAEAAGVTRPTALDRLNEALEEGRVKRATIGQANGWWLKDDPITAARAEEIGSSEQGTPVEDKTEYATEGGAPASGQLGDIVEGMNDLREMQVRMGNTIEKLESRVAQAQHAPTSAESDTVKRVDERVDERLQEHEHENRKDKAADAAAVSLFLGIALSVFGQWFGGGEIVVTIAGILLLFCLVQAANYLRLRYLGPSKEDATEESDSTDMSGATKE